MMASQAQILLAWDEYGDVVHYGDDSALPGDDKDAIAGSLLRQCGAEVGGLASVHPQQQQQQHLDSKRSRATTGKIRGSDGNGGGGCNDDKSLLWLGQDRHQKALLQRIRLMNFVGTKSSEELEKIEAEAGNDRASRITSTRTNIGGFTLSYHDIAIDSQSASAEAGPCPTMTSIDSDDGGPTCIVKSKENSKPASTNQRQMNKEKGAAYKSSVRASAAMNRRRARTRNTRQDRMADTDNCQWDDGKRQALQRKLESSRGTIREIDHAIKGDMIFVHQSYRRGGEQPILREELHRLGARALSAACDKLTIRLRRRTLKQWSQGVKRDVRREQILKLRQYRALKRLVRCVKKVTRESLASACFRWRVESERRRQEEREFSATRIQSALRSMLATKKLEELRAEKREWARQTLQRLFRGCSARMVFRNMICQRNRHNAAQMLQCCVRCWLARTMLKRLKLERQRQISAVIVQKMIRGRKGRKVALQALDCRRRRAAAIHIQRISRGRRDHVEYKKRRASIKRNRAATVLQAQVRRNRDTRYVARERKKNMKRERGTLMLQRIFRGHKCRQTMRRIQLEEIQETHRRYSSATIIQSLFRARVARHRVEAIRRTAITVMIREARQFEEFWNDDVNGWCYYNGKTGEMLLSPPITGYTRVADADADGPVLVLQSGRIISDPVDDDVDIESSVDDELCSEEERNTDLQV